jgi:hypothetical protein
MADCRLFLESGCWSHPCPHRHGGRRGTREAMKRRSPRGPSCHVTAPEKLVSSSGKRDLAGVSALPFTDPRPKPGCFGCTLCHWSTQTSVMSVRRGCCHTSIQFLSPAVKGGSMSHLINRCLGECLPKFTLRSTFSAPGYKYAYRRLSRLLQRLPLRYLARQLDLTTPK